MGMSESFTAIQTIHQLLEYLTQNHKYQSNGGATSHEDSASEEHEPKNNKTTNWRQRLKAAEPTQY